MPGLNTTCSHIRQSEFVIIKIMDNISSPLLSDSNICMDKSQITEEYFSSYNNIEVHRLMLSDVPRTEAYRNAILKNKHLFKGKIVMDVGAGTGILSLFMAEAGAQKVYAIEPSNFASVIKKISKDNGYENVIEVFNCEVEKLQLPDNRKVDVIVSEWMGFYLLHESMLSSVIFARDNFLDEEEGLMFPSEARLYACPCTLENLYKKEVQFWDNVFGYNLSACKDLVFEEKRKKPTISLITSEQLLSNPISINTFDLKYVTNDEIQKFSCKNFVGITKNGNYRGLALWFECDFDGVTYNEGEELGCKVTLSTSPDAPSTHWKQTLFVFGRTYLTINNTENMEETQTDDYLVEKDEVVGWALNFCQDIKNPRTYNLEVEILDPESEEHSIPCDCPMIKCVIIKKMIDNEDNDEDNIICDENS